MGIYIMLAVGIPIFLLFCGALLARAMSPEQEEIEIAEPTKIEETSKENEDKTTNKSHWFPQQPNEWRD